LGGLLFPLIRYAIGGAYIPRLITKEHPVNDKIYMGSDSRSLILALGKAPDLLI